MANTPAAFPSSVLMLRRESSHGHLREAHHAPVSTYPIVQWNTIDSSSPYHPRHRTLLCNGNVLLASYRKINDLEMSGKRKPTAAGSESSLTSDPQDVGSFIEQNSLESFVTGHDLPSFVSAHSLQGYIRGHSAEKDVVCVSQTSHSANTTTNNLNFNSNNWACARRLNRGRRAGNGPVRFSLPRGVSWMKNR